MGFGVRIRAEVATNPLSAIHARHERSLSGAALGKSLNTQGGIESPDDVDRRGLLVERIGPLLIVCQATNEFSLVGEQGIGGRLRAQAYAVEKHKENSFHDRGCWPSIPPTFYGWRACPVLGGPIILGGGGKLCRQLRFCQVAGMLGGQ